MTFGSFPDGCSWENNTPEENCKYFQDYISKANELGMKMEIMLWTAAWIGYFKDRLTCP